MWQNLASGGKNAHTFLTFYVHHFVLLVCLGWGWGKAITFRATCVQSCYDTWFLHANEMSHSMLPTCTGAVTPCDITCKRDVTHVTLHAFCRLTFRRYAKEASLATKTKDRVNPKIMECVKLHAWRWEHTGDNLMRSHECHLHSSAWGSKLLKWKGARNVWSALRFLTSIPIVHKIRL